MLQVRAELLDATQKALEGHAQPEVTEANIQRLVEKRTRELEVKDEPLCMYIYRYILYNGMFEVVVGIGSCGRAQFQSDWNADRTGTVSGPRN